jgi:DNA-directed RNA polymerase specialized sigma24 family protein
LTSPALAEVVEQEENQQRRHSKPRRRLRWTDHVPIDEIAVQHQEIHADLQQWGRWNYTKRERSSLASIEGLYEKYRTAKATSPGELIDLRSIEVERAVLKMPKMYRDTLRLVYVQEVSSYTICRIFKVRYEAYVAWMFTARCMVKNLLRRNAA